MNISEATRNMLGRYPYLEEYMEMGIVNNRGLARLILNEVAGQAGVRPNIQSVVSALRRQGKSGAGRGKANLERILAKSTVNLRFDMAAVTLSVGQKGLGRIKGRLLSEGSYILLQGMESLTIVADERTIKNVQDQISDEILEVHSNLAIAVVKSPREITKTSGVLAHLANILAIEKINIVEMMSSHAETAFIIEEKDALRTIEVLRSEIKRSRKKLQVNIH